MSNKEPSYDHFGFLAFLFSMATVTVFFVYVVAVYPGIDLLEDLKDPSAAPAQNAVDKVDISKISEPWKPNADMVVHGKGVYAANCAMCHGAEGRGDGPAGAALNPKSRNLVTGPWKLGGGYIGLYKVLTEGIPGGSMASYAHLSSADRWALVQFIDSITQAKVTEDPAEVEEFAKAVK